MNAVFDAAVIVAWLALLSFSIIWPFVAWAADSAWKWPATVLGLIGFIAAIAILISAMSDDAEMGPCLRTEEGTAYNAATKTVMPYTYCAERGTWKK